MARPKKTQETEEITMNGEQVLIELTRGGAVIPEAKTALRHTRAMKLVTLSW